MRSTLVIEGGTLALDAVAKAFSRACHSVTVAIDDEAGAIAFAKERHDVVIVGWHHDAASGIAKLRALPGGPDAWIIAVLPDCSDEMLDAAFEAGVNDFVSQQLSLEEFVARAGVSLRHRRIAPPPPPPATLSARPRSHDLAAIDAFQNMGSIVALDLVDLVGPGDVADGFLVSGDLHGASIPMSFASENAEIRVSIVVEKRSLKTLAGILLCDESSSGEAIADMMREVANTAGGSVKRAAERDGFHLTTGLPVDEQARGSRSEVTRCWTISLHGSEARIGIVGDIQRRVVRQVSIEEAREGMVMAAEVRGADNTLVLSAGDRLTLSAITDVRSKCGAEQQLSVIDS